MQDLEKIDSTCLKASQIIKGLKVFSRQEEDSDRGPFVLTKMLDNTFSFVIDKFRTGEVSFEFINELDEASPMIFGNSISLSQVLVNLINNAFYQVKEMSVPWVKVILKKSPDKQSYRLSVMDAGNGIPGDVKEKLFTPFFTTKPIGFGTGLGLSVSSAIVENHGGKLYVSDADHTEFVVEIPIYGFNAKHVEKS